MALSFDNEDFPSMFFKRHSTTINLLKNYPERTSLNALQLEALVKLSTFYETPRPNNTALIVLPTGTGKSGIAALAPYVVGAKRVLVLTPSIVISRQLLTSFGGGTSEEEPLPSFYEEIGLITGKDRGQFHEHPLLIESTSQVSQIPNFNLVISNAHKFGVTSNTKITRVPADFFDFIIVDEAHHYPANTWRNIVDHFQHQKKLFLTATPKNRGYDILEDQDKCVCLEKSYQECVKIGTIRKRLFQSVGNLYAPDIFEDSVAFTVIMDQLKKHDFDDPTVQHKAMILTNTTNEADKVSNYLSLLGVSARSFYAPMDKSIVDDFKAGIFRILIVCGSLLEGFDHKPVSIVLILRDVASKVLFTQFVGRAVRKAHYLDPVTALIYSHHRCNLLDINEFENMATVDPPDDSDTHKKASTSSMTTELIDGIDGTLSENHREIAVELLDQLQSRNLLGDVLVGSDGEDGLSMRWPKARMFCEIWEESIHVSVVTKEKSVTRNSFLGGQCNDACDSISKILSNNEIEMEVI